ncbi:MAG: oligosaccharide flippase family protein [Acidobacteriota bacterium]|nr:oligosaccharide flippase family protein [Acidobacteriota bacterium]
MKRLTQRLAESTLLRNAISLYGVQACRKVVPLISIPFLARALGPAGWGRAAFALSMGDFIVLVIEFGFTLSATREIARHRDDMKACGEIATGTLGAQAVLSCIAVLCALIVASVTPMLRNDPKLVGTVLFYGVAQGLAPIWFFQGLERIHLAAGLEIAGKLLALAGLLAFVRHAGDEWKVLALQGIAPALAVTGGLSLAHRIAPFSRPSRAGILHALRTGWGTFLLRSGVSMYSVGNGFILGLFAPAPTVGFFTSSEKICKAVCGLLLPIRDAIYPRLSHLAAHSPEKTERLHRLGVIVMGLGGIFLSAATFFGAPLMIRILLGPGFEQAVPVLRILALLPAIIALTDSIGMQWLLPRGREGDTSKVILAGGLLNVALAMLAAPHFRHIGMAWSVVTSETFVCLALVLIVIRSVMPSVLRWPSPVVEKAAGECVGTRSLR